MPTTIITGTPQDNCTEIHLKVMIFSPEAGFKFEVTVERTCFPTKWHIIFNLFKKTGNDFVQLVGVDFEAEKKVEETAIATMSTQGIGVLQSRAFRKKVYPLVKAGASQDQIHQEISDAVQQQ
jgi:hypothetical protein